MAGGTGIFVQALARSLVQRGHRVTVVGVWDQYHDGLDADRGVEIHRIARSRLPTCRFLPHAWRVGQALRRIHANTPIDIVETSNDGLAFLSRSLPGVKIVRMHGGHIYHCRELHTRYGPWRYFQERRSFQRADFICSCGEHVGRTTAGLLGIPFDQVTVIHNLADAIFTPIPDATLEPNRLLFVGVVHENKGIRQLVLAMLEVLQEFPAATLVIAGRDKTNPKSGRTYREEVIQPLIPDRWKDRFNFLGRVKHDSMPRLIAESALCVYPSHTEAMPVAWIETMAMGRPIVGADIGPGRELIADGKNGLLCNPHEPSDIADKIKRLLRTPVLAEQLGKQGRLEFEKRFEREILIDKNIAFYRRCIGEPILG